MRNPIESPLVVGLPLCCCGAGPKKVFEWGCFLFNKHSSVESKHIKVVGRHPGPSTKAMLKSHRLPADSAGGAQDGRFWGRGARECTYRSWSSKTKAN
ncbi:hypothetical protein EVAR_46973_1 [Eumeta japonica]|uniref:Uncharacterized protein n=1 Tax=Eumeta variegata TaxID=151549 RepID=A0A4C1X7Q5_EUMVA|nr:hypothetical protein EVAR_46973_1 [Eumeta japonica]